MKYTPAQIKKFLVAAVGFTLTVLSALLQGNLIPKNALPWVLIVISVISSYSVFKVKNEPIEQRSEYGSI